jgi:ParB family chromosome partitioning protein
MMKPTGGLGRGLGALLPVNSPTVQKTQNIQQAGNDQDLSLDIVDGLRIEHISPFAISENPHQPRKVFSEEELDNLKDSIAEHGILQPLVVSKSSDGKYELIAGERRLRASRMLNLKEIPVIVRPEITDQKKLELAIIENIQRQELNAVEEAQAYDAMADIFSLTQTEIAKKVGKSQSYVANLMRLLDLDEDMLQALSDGKISKSHARTLLAEGDLGRRRMLFESMLGGRMTVREAESRAGSRKVVADKDPNVVALENELRDRLGTKVQINMKDGRGRISINFYSRADLKKIIEDIID